MSAGQAVAEGVVPPVSEAPNAAEMPFVEGEPKLEPEQDTTKMKIQKPAEIKGFNPLKTEPEPADWNALFRFAYFSPFDDGDSSGRFLARGGYQLDPNYSLYAAQTLAINFVVDASKDEVEWGDTALGIERNLGQPFPKAQWGLGFEVGLPLSRTSRYNETYLTAEVSSGLSFALNPAIKLGLSGAAGWIWSAFETAPASDGDGGETLPHFSFTLIHDLQYAINDLWSVRYGIVYTETVYHAVEHDSSSDSIVYDLPDQGYNLEAGVSRSLTLRSKLGLSYSMGSTLLQPGFDDYVIYDKASSRWSLSFSHTMP